MTKMPLLMLLCGSLMIAGPALAGDAAAGKAKSDDCADCHGAGGKGGDNTQLAGMPAAKFTKLMKGFQAGEGNKKMVKIAKKLSDDDIADLAAFFASQK
jgi:cytochrome c553